MDQPSSPKLLRSWPLTTIRYGIGCVPARRATWFGSTPELSSQSLSPTSPPQRVHPGDLVGPGLAGGRRLAGRSATAPVLKRGGLPKVFARARATLLAAGLE